MNARQMTRHSPAPHSRQFVLPLLVAAAAMLFAPRASAQLEEFGVQNTNNSSALQQQGLEEQKQAQQQTGQCTDPDPTNCGAGGASGGRGNAQGGTAGNFQFQQPLQNSLGGRNERYQPRYTFQPQQPTEFQRYVADSAGIFLPIFGADLFQTVPSTFAPLENVPVPQDYVIGPGDEILLQAYGQVTFDLRLTVDRDGQIDIPHVGAVRVVGLKFSQLDPFLRQEIGKQFRNFTLNVTMGQLRSIQVFVTGRARRPGNFTISSLSTLLNAIFAVGGPAPDGSMRRIELRRDGTVVTTFDLYDLLLRGDKSKDRPLLPGDVIYFPEAGPRVAVYGSVDRPAIYEVLGQPTIARALALAGGATVVAATQHVEVQRIEDHKLRHVLDVALDAEGREAVLHNGDVLHVLSQVPRFDNAVVLRGNVANPGTYAWHEGMRIRDLVPDKDSLLTRDYWKERARLGLPVLDYTPAETVNPTADTTVNLNQRVVSGNQVSELTAQRAGQTLAYGVEGQTAQAAGNQLLPQPGNSAQQSNAQRQGGLTANSLRVQQNVIGNATAAGAAPPLAQQFPPRNAVELPVPDIDWSYAVIERTNKQTLKTELVPFHLDDLVLNGDEAQDLLLQPGDVVTIFSQADIRIPRQEQTRLVHIEGEVAHPGVYSVEPGDTLRTIVERAGGLTPNAYLYGTSFTRESVRQQQQQRLEEYVSQLEKDLQHSAEQAAADSGNANAAPGATTTLQQQTIAQLRGLRASGRVVLNIRPDDHDVAALPNIPLEDGDHLLVPPVPSSVNVIGSVYNQSSFVYEEGRREGEYLRQAGGADRLADVAHEFIVRADGAVVSRNFSAGKLLASFASERMNPGDTIVVPQKLIHPSSLRLFLEYAGVFSSLALTAATIAIIQ